MRVRVHHFAALRETRGVEHEDVQISSGSTVGQLYRELFPGPERSMRVLFAVNQEYASADRALEAGDEVAFIPPLGGG
ncbi:MAG: MoaD/ThiS family protein [Myxococcota bacterium]|jgi:molybdopterin converting factor subunit 1|nr:MoaD/ThiS family protein [Myxococcota bacterium]